MELNPFRSPLSDDVSATGPRWYAIHRIRWTSEFYGAVIKGFGLSFAAIALRPFMVPWRGIVLPSIVLLLVGQYIATRGRWVVKPEDLKWYQFTRYHLTGVYYGGYMIGFGLGIAMLAVCPMPMAHRWVGLPGLVLALVGLSVTLRSQERSAEQDKKVEQVLTAEGNDASRGEDPATVELQPTKDERQGPAAPDQLR